MAKQRAWPAKAMYFLIAAALAISLIIVAAPAQKASAQNDGVDAEWERVGTPTMAGWVLAPESYIIDACYADGGEVAYAVVYAYDEDCDDSSFEDDDYRLLKSDTYAATWDDLTDAVDNALNKRTDATDDDEEIEELIRVATDWEDSDFVAVAIEVYDEVTTLYTIHVLFSTDGGNTFEDAGEVEDGPLFDDPEDVSDMVVSPESGGEREIAIGGMDGGGEAALFRCTVDGDSAGAWEDATAYTGWDDNGVSFDSEFVTDIIFSSSWGTDNTILVVTVDDPDDIWNNAPDLCDVHLQCGSWGNTEGWNEWSTLGIEAVLVLEDEILPQWLYMDDARGIAGMALPEDYDSDNASDRLLWVWVNYYNSVGECMCALMRVEDDSADLIGPMGEIEDGEIWLTNISYQGTIAEGKAIAGVLGTGSDEVDLLTECHEGVQVYRNDGIRNMDICCERWQDACKPPTGNAAMGVAYVGDGKAYAVALGGTDNYEEGAVSVTWDDGDTWNQLSLIDTYIQYLSDVAVSPDCNKTFLATVNYRGCSSDSVWLHAENLPEDEDYSGQWLRTWCGHLEGWNNSTGDHTDFPWVSRRSLLRLDPEETTGDTVFLVDRMSGNVYRNDLETLACWEPIASTEVNDIVDLVALDADTLFALGHNGDVAMFDDDEWQEAVESEVDGGWTIAVWGDYVLVGGVDGDVCYTDNFDPDAEDDVFTELEDVIDNGDGAHVTVAFDSYFDQNDTIYAALANADDDNGIYILVIDGETEDWTKLDAKPFNYTGLVLDRAEGNPWTSPETGGVLYASYRMWGELDNCDPCCGNAEHEGDLCWYTGVARCLTPIVEICCGAGEAEWNYLTWGLENDTDFAMPPQALKICGCLSADSNTKLFTIDRSTYDMCDGEDGEVWTFEDCYSKKGVELTSPDDGEVIDSSFCDWCANEPFRMTWDRLCDACCYEVEFAMDEDFTDLYRPYGDYGPCGDGDPEVYECCRPSWFCPDEPTDPSVWIEPMFLAETTYYYRVRAVEAETCQDITSWWSEPRSFTVAPTPEAAAIELISPEPGALEQPTIGLGFSWDLLADADNFDWVLDDNSDFSSPDESETDLTNKAYKCTQTLDYDTTYFWQVTAYSNGAEIGKSAIGTFTTGAETQYCCPQCGLCFDTQAELEEHAATYGGTPVWVWVVIAIGAALVIVVIVLIFRTRRV